jgi:acetyltransferase-like isoleucine patch superfamily enzyme
MEVSERLEKLKILQNKCRIDQAMWKNDLIDVGEFTYGRPIVLQWDKHTRLKIGKFCSIGANVQIYLGGEHHTEWITTYPFDVLMGEAETPSKGNVTIGNDVWLGNNVTILSGVTIGDGAVIGNGAVVTKDLRPFTISAGNPASFIRYRYAAHNLKHWDRLLWWDWPLEKLAEAVQLLMAEDVAELVDFDRRWKDG